MMWHVVCQPQGRYTSTSGEDDDETRDMKVMIVCEEFCQVLCCVGFTRDYSNNPTVDYLDQLDKGIARARKAVTTLNEILDSDSDGGLA